MKKKVKNPGVLSGVLVLLILIFSACPVTPKQADEAIVGTDGFEEVNELFADGDEEGKVVFATNDPAYWSTLGYTLWALNGEVQEPFVSREVKCNKISGAAGAGYGLVFCHWESSDPDTGETMLTVMINTLGEYIVGEVADDTFYEFFPWRESEYLKKGYNQGNVVGLRWDSGESRFELSFNGYSETTFTDETEPLHTGGENGYIVVISPADTFPENPVQVVFTE
ncbi:hypothetical protein [Marispirochaeta sp.]|uniref:hypothetical protein n=1 Tax=Marispirochaeta sp. TaxID=2038653 RepID=UPI0029C8D4CB|nr:hypothetical protein [Marispirochaeta sp.]